MYTVLTRLVVTRDFLLGFTGTTIQTRWGLYSEGVKGSESRLGEVDVEVFVLLFHGVKTDTLL